MHHSIRRAARVMSAGLVWSTLGCRAADMSHVGANVPAGLFAPGPRVPAGTTLVVRLARTLSSAAVAPGDPWRGVTTMQVLGGDRVLVPGGAEVRGTVVGVRTSRHGGRAMVHLRVCSIVVDGRSVRLDADAEPVVTGSSLPRNAGAIAGPLAGGLVTNAEADDTPPVATGDAATTVAPARATQVVLRDGTVMTFVTNESATLR